MLGLGVRVETTDLSLDAGQPVWEDACSAGTGGGIHVHIQGLDKQKIAQLPREPSSIAVPAHVCSTFTQPAKRRRWSPTAQEYNNYTFQAG